MSTIATTMIEVDHMIAIEIGTRRNSIGVTIPECSSVTSGVQHAVER